jgi:hypothetical protein
VCSTDNVHLYSCKPSSVAIFRQFLEDPDELAGFLGRTDDWNCGNERNNSEPHTANASHFRDRSDSAAQHNAEVIGLENSRVLRLCAKSEVLHVRGKEFHGASSWEKQAV